VGIEDVTEYTFFVDAEAFGLGGFEASALAADESDLHRAGVVAVDIPTGYGLDLGERIPVRVQGTARGLRFYARLLSLRDPVQLEELERVCQAVLERSLE
jgi:NAD(P)H-hydrate repair Nnr-like enzyme with NAD(P)H-hydrate epimerase domain